MRLFSTRQNEVERLSLKGRLQDPIWILQLPLLARQQPKVIGNQLNDGC